MKSIVRLCAMAVAAAGLMLPAAHAQTKAPTASPGATVQPADISDSKLDAAAAAAREVSTIRNSYEQKVAEATDNGEKQRLVGEADSKMTKAVTDKGLSVEEYMSIIQVAQNDATVRSKLLQRLKD